MLASICKYNAHALNFLARFCSSSRVTACSGCYSQPLVSLLVVVVVIIVIDCGREIVIAIVRRVMSSLTWQLDYERLE
jgi:hypothetical protein